MYVMHSPSVISVSGGRTSGFMLAKIVAAHHGTLPHDVIPVFCNTGLEHPNTYAFLEQLSEHIAPIRWLEYDVRDGHPTFREVDACSAARNGEPFEKLIDHKKLLPNPVARLCTSNLKIRTVYRFCKSLGWADWDNAIGLRADEPHRVHRLKSDRVAETPIFPMYHAGHDLGDVESFWAKQDFDLQLPGGNNTFGNCVGCFLKSRSKLELIAQTNPEHLDWWARAEQRVKTKDGRPARFRVDRASYQEMLTQITVQGRLFDDRIDEDILPCHCTD